MRIRDWSSSVSSSDPGQGMNHSQVMVIAQEMTDGLGPRLTNSPGMRRAEQWAIDKFNGWGLANVHRDGFEFGRGWEIVLVSARMMSPRPLELTAIPVAWTPPTTGAVSAPIVVAPMTKEEHFAAWKGKLAGQIVLVSRSEEHTSEIQYLMRS